MFNILICGGYIKRENKVATQVKVVKVNNFKEYYNFPSMLEERHHFKGVYLKWEVYVIGGFNKVSRTKSVSVEKYSPLSKKWIKVTDIPDKRQNFCGCAYIDNIFIFGGFEPGPGYLNSCLQFNAKLLKWNEVAKMNEQRSVAACAIYYENIVVSGGLDDYFYSLSSVESYDVFANVWTPMPNMIEERSNHSLIFVKSKLFAIGGTLSNTNCEVFDKISNMFVTFKTPKFRSFIVTAVSIGGKIFVFQNESQVVLCYDVDKDEWTENSCKATEKICDYSPVRVPLY